MRAEEGGWEREPGGEGEGMEWLGRRGGGGMGWRVWGGDNRLTSRRSHRLVCLAQKRPGHAAVVGVGQGDAEEGVDACGGVFVVVAVRDDEPARGELEWVRVVDVVGVGGLVGVGLLVLWDVCDGRGKRGRCLEGGREGGVITGQRSGQGS